MLPSSVSFSNGVVAVTVPIFEADGHAAGASVPSPIWASEHPSSPSAEEGEMVIPAGSVIRASFRCAGASPVGLVSPSWGKLRSTVSPVGESGEWDSGSTPNEGANGSDSQPVVP